MFFKLNETWYKGTLSNGDYGFDVQILEVFFVHKFLGQIFSKN